MKKGIALAALLLLVLPVVYAGDFTVGTSSTEQNVCATDTVLYVLTVQNTDSGTDSYTVSLSGDAAKWAVAAPAGFTLKSQETTQVYVYVTPVSGALPGAYGLEAKVNGQETLLKVDVGDCHSATLTSEVTTQSICADTSAEYSMILSNTGKYTETFDLSLSGTAAKWATLSEKTLKLVSGQTASIKVTATPPADQTGLLDLTVTAKAENSNAAARLQLGVQSNNCYEFDLMLDKNYLSFCENSEVKMPITINNGGNLDNTYTITASGVNWASVENEKLDVPAKGSRVTNLVLFPDYGVSGSFKITVKAVSEKGETVSEQIVTTDVQACHSTDLKISVDEDTVCPFTIKAYEVSLKNTGTFDERYSVTLSGADFATLDKSFVDVAAGKIENINLIIDTKDLSAGAYSISVKAEAQDPAHARSSDTLELKIEPKESCFGVLTTAALTRVQAAPGEGTLVPVIIENKGTEESTFNLEVSGTGAAYAKLNPAVVTMEGRRARTAYLYIAVPEETARKEYLLTISARLQDGTVSSSSNVVLDVVPPTAVVTSAMPTPAEQVQGVVGTAREKLNSIRDSVKGFFDKVENLGKAGISKIKEMSSKVISKIKIPAEETEEPKIEEPAEEATETQENSQFLSEAAQKKLAESKEAVKEVPIKAEAVVQSMAAKVKNALPTFENIKSLDTLKSIKNRIAGINLPGETAREGSFVDRIKQNIKRLIGFSGISGGDLTSSGLIEKVKSLFTKAKTFLFEKTYKFPNWAWLAGIVAILAIISYLLKDEDKKPLVNGENKKGKGMFGRFMDWLEEEDEPSQQPQAAEQQPAEPPKPKAQDILKEVEKEQNEEKEKPKPAPKKKGRPKKK